jgi:HAD superfamily hydrolase (TIGR01509 family)
MRVLILAMCVLLMATSSSALTPQQILTQINNGEITSVIFDVNGALLIRNRWRSMKHVGFGSMLCALCEGKNFWDKDELFRQLRRVPSAYDGEELQHGGRVMPGIMADWQIGTVSGEEALARCNEVLNNREVLPGILRLMFNPDVLADVHEVNPDALLLLQALRARNIPTYVISNMDRITAERLTDKFSDIFGGMAGIVWSANVFAVKPTEEIFTIALERFQLDARAAVFIDDEEVNREGAENVGLRSMEETGMKTLAQGLRRSFTADRR